MKPSDPGRDNPAFQTVDAVLLLHETDRHKGLTTRDAARRLAGHGPNALVATPGPPAWRRALSQFQDPLIYLLLFAITVSVAVWALEGFGGWPIDAMVIASIVLLNGLLGYVQQAKAANALAALAHMTEVTNSVIRDGESLRIPSADLVPGDLLVLGEGDAVGADARLIKATALRVQEGSLTGESEAVAKDVATVRTPAALGDRSDMVFKGTSIAQGTGQAIVTATGMRTEMGAVAALLKATVEPPSPLEVEVARVGRMLGIVIAIITLVVVATVLSLSDLRGPSDFVAVLLLGVSLAVAAVPEGLPAILSVVLALGVQRMARRNAIVKNLSSVETLGAASVICSDKTGTLTRAEMTLQRTITASGSCNFTGIGYAPTGRVESGGETLGAGPLCDEVTLLLGGGCLAGDAQLGQDADGRWRIHGDPTEAAFLVAERKLGAETHTQRLRRFERVAEIPFTSERKMMSTIQRDHDQGGSQRLFTKGAPDVLLGRCTHIQVGDKVVALDAALRARVLADVADLSDAALRTLSVAWRKLASGDEAMKPEALEQDLVLVGTVGIIDPPRKEAAVAIGKARCAGIRVVMITGDHPRTALRIACDLGIGAAGSGALTGLQIDAMDDAALAQAVLDHAVYARVAPAHKLRIVAALQSGGAVVAMTGDGVNDAPALKAADIGIAMGITGTEVSRQAARMILADDNFATIVVAVEEGRGIFDSIRKFLRYLLSSNMGEVLTVFLGVVGAGVIGLQDAAPGVVLPLLATQILWVNLVTDSGPALAMGVDPAARDVMTRGPRRRDERIIDAAMWWGVVEIGTVMAVATLLTIDLYLPGGLIAGTHDLTTARTAGFTVLVLAQLFNCFNARSDETSAFSRLFENPWLWAAVSLSALLQVAVVELDFLGAAFGTAPLAASEWLTCIAMASSVLWFSELRKAVRRLFHRRKAGTAGVEAVPA